ncbi:MAG TPA: bacillithiol biosynthesis cysteine-adding enzyme BshC [Gemmatimonadales bacterium]|nr:bacillithiol biosynthesis cysteine-adding enzyme BshC [Gemmatimonadales bacterium]
MTFRFVPTPLDTPLVLPEPRDGGLQSALREAFVPSAARETALARLSQPGALAVTSGQQPGLFTGPLYTVHKALSTAALARVLERQWSRPVVPIFWIAGDDHDFAEASHTAWLGADGSLLTGSLPPRPTDAPLTPMYHQPLGHGVVAALEALGASLPASEFRDETLAWLGRHYRPEATVAAAFAGAMAELVAPSGIVCFDSTHPAAKAAAAPIILRALEHAGAIDADLERQSEALGETARTSGVTVGDGAALAMLEGKQGRDRLVVSDGGYVTRRGRERFSLEDLAAIAEREPRRLSPNVLLRPVVESALLPTVSYLGGPAELRYLAFTPPVYRRLGVERQRPLPRWSGVLVEPRVDRVLEKFGIDLAELLEPSGSLEGRLVRSRLPGEALEALASIRAALEQGYGRLEQTASDIDPTLVRPIQGARHQALAGTQDIEKKLVQHLKRRQETELGQIGRARTAVLPGGKPQERVLTVAPFLARYGPALVDDLRDAIEGWYAGALEGASTPS